MLLTPLPSAGLELSRLSVDVLADMVIGFKGYLTLTEILASEPAFLEALARGIKDKHRKQAELVKRSRQAAANKGRLR